MAELLACRSPSDSPICGSQKNTTTTIPPTLDHPPPSAPRKSATVSPVVEISHHGGNPSFSTPDAVVRDLVRVDLIFRTAFDNEIECRFQHPAAPDATVGVIAQYVGRFQFVYVR